MTINNSLQIILITYNRYKYLQRTLEQILAFNSPIRNCPITILDNASNDGTSELIEEYCHKFSNIKHIRHKINIGGNANTCRAYEIGACSGKEYLWVLCDDDRYDFSNWSEVEKAAAEKNDIICVSNYVFQNKYEKSNKACQIFQLTFVPAGIYKTNMITDSVLTNMYDAIYTLFQQSVIAINVINNKGKIKVLSKPIVFNGLDFENREEDISLTRGYSEKFLSTRQKMRSWILGFSGVITLLKDKTLQKECLEVAIPYKDIYSCWENFYTHLDDMYVKSSNISYFFEIFNILHPKRQKEFIKRYLFNTNNILRKTGLVATPLQIFYSFLQQIFSIKNGYKHTVIRLLGLKLKIRKNPTVGGGGGK